MATTKDKLAILTKFIKTCHHLSAILSAKNKALVNKALVLQ